MTPEGVGTRIAYEPEVTAVRRKPEDEGEREKAPENTLPPLLEQRAAQSKAERHMALLLLLFALICLGEVALYVRLPNLTALAVYEDSREDYLVKR